MNRVLFLCTGNYYRSRFAEVLFNWHARQRRLEWTADSRGLQLDPLNPGPISRHTLSWLTSRGILCESFARLPMPAADADFTNARACDRGQGSRAPVADRSQLPAVARTCRILACPRSGLRDGCGGDPAPGVREVMNLLDQVAAPAN